MTISACRRRTCLSAVSILLFAAPAWAVPLVVNVRPPSGGDDTQAIQSALDRCVKSGQECTVQLRAGTYRTRQLVAYDFRGTFAGKGKNSTYVEPFGTLTVCPVSGCGYKPPDTTTNLWTDLVIFVNGRVTVSDMSFRLTTVPATTPWVFPGGTRQRQILISAIRVLGSRPTDVSIQRVAIEGASDDTSPWGYNLLNCVIVAAELFRPDVDPNNFDLQRDTYPLTGTFDFKASSFQTCGSGLGIARLVRSQVRIGGSNTQGNTFADTLMGVELANIEKSLVDVSWNSIRTAQSANLIAYQLYYPGQAASLYAIHDNSFDVGGTYAPYADGIYLLDNDTSPKVINAAVVNNKVRGEDCQFGLIHAINTDGSLIAANEVSGTSVSNPFLATFGGIVVESGTHLSILGNDIADLTVTPGPLGAAIYLDSGTSGSLVVGACRPGDVEDLGTNDKVFCLPW